MELSEIKLDQKVVRARDKSGYNIGRVGVVMSIRGVYAYVMFGAHLFSTKTTKVRISDLEDATVKYRIELKLGSKPKYIRL